VTTLIESRMPPGPIETRGAWLGQDLASTPQRWTYHLTGTDVAELCHALGSVRDRGLALHQIASRDFVLPTLGPRLKTLTRDIAEGLGFLLLRGFPTEGLSVEDITTLYFGCLTHVGLPIAQSAGNDLVGHVRDEGGPAATTRGYQTSKALGYHSDSSDLVALFCVKPAASGGLSKIMSAVKVHNIVQAERPDLLRVLYEQPFHCSWSGHEPKGQPPYYWVRFFSWYGGRLQISGIKERYVDDPPLSPEQREAVAFVRGIQESREAELHLPMDFEPGDVQILDNSIIWHSRTAFADHEDPALRRHLLRVWLNYYAERPVAPDFWNRYDAVGQLTSSPKRALFDVEVYDTW